MTDQATPTESVETTPTLSSSDILRAATNAPELSPDEFELGGRKFKLLDLSYDDYLKFLELLQPMFEAVIGGLTSRTSVDLPGLPTIQGSLDASGLFKYCSTQLPEMARIVCKQSAPDITIDELKELAKNPFKLAEVVLRQVKRNNLIQDFTSFFAQVLPLLTSFQKR